MSFRFRKRIRLAKGIWINLSQKGTSLSVGGRGVTTNISEKGVREKFSVPGTGISYQTKRLGASGCLVLLLGIPTAIAAALFLLN
ncbi:MAG: DUF4236 domain-containing protein [Verrucomicrobia bacterium]|nr:DUF4236 domain-containing protein [Verrucomicrobiota bacterium]